MTRGLVSTLLLALLAAGAASIAEGAVAWNETVNGDLSNSGLAPTPLGFVEGSNEVRGSTGNANQGERDYFNFVVPPGGTLTAIMVLPETFTSGPASFMGMQAGPQVTGMTAANLIGFIHYGPDQIGQNIIGAFTTDVLGPGTYSVWLQELGSEVDYGFDFQLTLTPSADVPLPAAALVLLGGLFGVAGLRRLRARAA